MPREEGPSRGEGCSGVKCKGRAAIVVWARGGVEWASMEGGDRSGGVAEGSRWGVGTGDTRR